MRRGHGDASTRNLKPDKTERERFCLADAEVLELADCAIRIEDHYSRARRAPDADGHRMGQGRRGRQALHRPGPPRDGRLAAGSRDVFETYALKGDGSGAGHRPGGRREDRLRHGAGGRGCRAGWPPSSPGDVLVAETTTPDWEPVMKTATAIVTRRGGRTCHAAIVARELGMPSGGRRGTALDSLKTGAVVTVSCAEGEIGKVYDGRSCRSR